MKELPGRLKECFGAKTPKRVQKINNLLTIPTSGYYDSLNKFLDVDTADWTPPGRKICGVLLSSGMVQGQYREGKWVNISKNEAVVIPYSWIELVTGHIIDPCRWFMKNKRSPRLSIVKESDYYDLDGSLLRSNLPKIINLKIKTHKDFRPDFYSYLTSEEIAFIENLFGFPNKITMEHISFLVNKVNCIYSDIYIQTALDCGLDHIINESIINSYYEDTYERNGEVK